METCCGTFYHQGVTKRAVVPAGFVTSEMVTNHAERQTDKERERERVMNSIKAIRTMKHSVIVQELCESRGGHPGLSVLTSLLASVDVKIY